MSQPTREKILDAVFKLVYINGYNGTSMAMILKECGIPKGSLYHYFKSKKEMVLAVVKERLAPRMDLFFDFTKVEGEHEIDTIINTLFKISQKQESVTYGCPLNRLNQEMSALDAEFEFEINVIYENIKTKITKLLENASLKEGIEIDSLAEFVIASTWGNLSLSPKRSSQERFLSTNKHLISYLTSLKD